MFDTIIYIPTILAYTFISLLVVILCFIVIYVSHKVYLNIYDILPVTTVEDPKTIYKSKSPPALRIYIMIGRSRLAVLVLHPKKSPGTQLLKYTDSISAIPWNDNFTTTSTIDGECNRYRSTDSGDNDHCGGYVT